MHSYELYRYRIRMLGEYQSPESRTAAIEGSYSYTETIGRSPEKSQRTSGVPSDFFRYRVIKRCLDVLLVLVSMPVMLLVLGGVSAVVMLSSPGPIFYSHRRIRKGGAFFSMWKFRTMVNDADTRKLEIELMNTGSNPEGLMFKMRHDPRVTRVGRLLRRTSLDELPQLFNVLLGEMSLVGPRPPLPDEVARYDTVELRRLAVKPGLTGLWQVSGRSDLSWDETISLDLRYVDNWSLYGDLVIIFRTFRAVVDGRGAY